MTLDFSAAFYIGHKQEESEDLGASQATKHRFPLGSHLVVDRGLYTHHGIYVGWGGVIHYSGLANGFTAGPVVHDYLESFAPDGKITVREYRSAKFKGKSVVERAESRLGENRYDVHSNNCEDFCSWAITGESKSDQVEFVEDLLGITSPILAAGLRVRKDATRERSGVEIGIDLASSVSTAALAVAMPAAIPFIVAGKVFKWITK